MSIITISKKLAKAGLVLLTAATLVVSALPSTALAAVQSPTSTAKVSFTFDDGLTSALTKAAPTLQKYGFSGTNYVITNCVGMSTVPNQCPADTDASYMTWAQIQSLRTTYGWEIGSHTTSHPQLATDKLTDAQLTTQLANSKAALAAQGIDAKAFADPYGDYNPHTVALIAKYYETHRGFWDLGANAWPNNEYLLRVQQVQVGVTVAQVKAYIDQAAAANQWLILVFHEIKDVPSANPEDYHFSTANLDAVAAYVKQKNLPVVNVSDAVVKDPAVNMLTNSSFDQGLTGWTTDSPTAVKADTANNGSYPSATNAASVTAGAANAHLFTQQITVDSTQTYMLKSFLNLNARTSGELGYYIDEYNANGKWISGQWKQAEAVVSVKNVNFTYKPTSANVKKASLQVYATANSGIKAYLDNFQWFPLQGSVPTPPPAPTNLVTNSTFDTGLTGWTTDSAATIKADATNNGSPANAQNSVSLASGATNGHLFSAQIAVDSTKSYSLTSYLKIAARTSGEVGFYIDEYDANGAWISGQWKTGIATVSTGNDVTLSYTPSSANVKKASLQVIVTASSGIQAYFDNVRWYQD